MINFCFFVPNESFTSATKTYIPFHAGMTWNQFFNYVTTRNVSGFAYELDSVWDASGHEHKPTEPDLIHI